MDVAATAWRDPKRPLWPLALVVPALPFLSVLLGGLSAGPASPAPPDSR